MGTLVQSPIPLTQARAPPIPNMLVFLILALQFSALQTFAFPSSIEFSQVGESMKMSNIETAVDR